jgi:hypothetical protein
MLLLGCKPTGRNTEQHDIFFGIGHSLKELEPQLEAFWPDGGKLHIDCWREVTQVDGYNIHIQPKDKAPLRTDKKLFFINLGGYKPHDFEEYHYKILQVAVDKAAAIYAAKQTAFYQHMGFKGAASHIDDKYGIDVDDIYEITDILSPALKQQFQLHLQPATTNYTDELHPGYTKLSSL